MKLALFLIKLLEALLNPGFGPGEAAALLGEPLKKDARGWELRPAVQGIGGARLHLEDLEAGKGLLTTIELEFKPIWRTSLAELSRAMGPDYRKLPSTSPEAPVEIVFDRKGEKLHGMIMLSLDPPPVDIAGGEFTVTSARVRRIFLPSSAALPQR